MAKRVSRFKPWASIKQDERLLFRDETHRVSSKAFGLNPLYVQIDKPAEGGFISFEACEISRDKNGKESRRVIMFSVSREEAAEIAAFLA